MPQKKTVEIYRDYPSTVEGKQVPAKVESCSKTASFSARDLGTSKTEAALPQARKHDTKPSFGKECREKKEALAQAGQVSITDDSATNLPRKVPKKIESGTDKEFTKDVLDEETHRKSFQKEILSETKRDVRQSPSESDTLKATTLAPSQKKISSDSQRANGPRRDENGVVEATADKNIDEPLTKAKSSTARLLSSRNDPPPIAGIRYPGLINEMFSCYQNTAFQILANIRPFADHVKRTRWADKDTPAAADLNIIVKRGTKRVTMKARSKARKALGPSKYANRAPLSVILLTINRAVASRLLKLFRTMHSQLDNGDLIDPGVATQVMPNLRGGKEYTGKTQQDSGEFLDRLIDHIAEEEKNLLQIKPEATEVNKLFRGKEEHKVSISISSLRRSQIANMFQVICSGCRHVSTQSHIFCGLRLEIPEHDKPITVEALLKDYSRTTRLPEDHKCEKCHEAGKTGKFLRVTEIPRYLRVMLDRTEQYFDKNNAVQEKKKKTRVPIPEGVIDLSNCCSSKVPSDKKSYAVRAVALHKGNS